MPGTRISLAQLMRAMEMDVVIDLSGYTEGTRLDVLAHRPAPTQMTYLGFPGTLGLPYIDYLISDPRIIPDELEQHYSEKILKLPHCYLPRDNTVSTLPSTLKPSHDEWSMFMWCLSLTPIFVLPFGSHTKMSASEPGAMMPFCGYIPNMRAGEVLHVSTQRSSVISPCTTP